jgi:Phage integrase, N-terminal SAM-like domain
MRLKHFSLKTEKSDLYYIRDFILFHNKRYPREIGVAEIRQYLSSDRHQQAGVRLNSQCCSQCPIVHLPPHPYAETLPFTDFV